MKDWLILRGREVKGERSGKWKRRGREEEEGEGRIKEKKKRKYSASKMGERTRERQRDRAILLAGGRSRTGDGERQKIAFFWIGTGSTQSTVLHTEHTEYTHILDDSSNLTTTARKQHQV